MSLPKKISLSGVTDAILSWPPETVAEMPGTAEREAASEFKVVGVVLLAPSDTEMSEVEIWPVALSRTWTVKEPLVGAKGSFVAAVLSSAAVGAGAAVGGGGGGEAARG